MMRCCVISTANYRRVSLLPTQIDLIKKKQFNDFQQAAIKLNGI